MSPPEDTLSASSRRTSPGGALVTHGCGVCLEGWKCACLPEAINSEFFCSATLAHNVAKSTLYWSRTSSIKSMSYVSSVGSVSDVPSSALWFMKLTFLRSRVLAKVWQPRTLPLLEAVDDGVFVKLEMELPVPMISLQSLVGMHCHALCEDCGRLLQASSGTWALFKAQVVCKDHIMSICHDSIHVCVHVIGYVWIVIEGVIAGWVHTRVTRRNKNSSCLYSHSPITVIK